MNFNAVFLIFAISFLHLYASGAVPVYFSVQKDQKIEVVHSGKSRWIVPVKESFSYKGDFPETVFTKAKRYKGKYGAFYLIDLSKNAKFFDATAYDELEIETDAKNFKIALADADMAKRESNQIIANNRYKIPLEPKEKGLDLHKLKYAVILTEDKISHLKVIFRKKESLEKGGVKLSLWAWQPLKVDAKELANAGIKRLYLQVGKGFSQAVEHLEIIKNPPEIYALDGSPEDINHSMELIKKFSKLPLNKLKGIQLDVEPYLLPNFLKNPQEIWKQYLYMLKNISSWCKSKGLRFSLVIPFWLDSVKYNKRSLLPQVLKLADEAVLMSYRSDTKSFIKISIDALRWGEVLKKPVALGIELTPIATQEHTVYSVGPKQPCIFENSYHDGCQTLKKLRSYKVLGSKITLFNNPKALKNILNLKLPFNSFDGFALHDYSMLKRMKIVLDSGNICHNCYKKVRKKEQQKNTAY